MTKTQPKSITFIMTNHSVQRMKERMPNYELPQMGAYVRLIKVKDTLYNKEMFILRVKGGAVLGQWTSGSYKFLILTMFDEETLRRLQKRKHSRFMPLESVCYQVNGVIETSDVALAASSIA